MWTCHHRHRRAQTQQEENVGVFAKEDIVRMAQSYMMKMMQTSYHGRILLYRATTVYAALRSRTIRAGNSKTRLMHWRMLIAVIPPCLEA